MNLFNLHLALPKDTIDSGQKVGIVSHECGKVYIEETGKCIHERIEAENESGIAFTNSGTSAVSKHINTTGQYPHWVLLTLVGNPLLGKRLFAYDFTLTTSIETVELYCDSRSVDAHNQTPHRNLGNEVDHSSRSVQQWPVAIPEH